MEAGTVWNVNSSVPDIVETTLSVITWLVCVREAVLLDGEDLCVIKVYILFYGQNFKSCEF